MHNEPSSLEQELRFSMRRIQAPPGFADDVLRRIESEPAEEHAAIPSACPNKALHAVHGNFRVLHRLVALLLLVLLIPLGDSLYKRHQQAQAERAAQQFALAMRLTHAALLDAGQQVCDHSHAHSTE